MHNKTYTVHYSKRNKQQDGMVKNHTFIFKCRWIFLIQCSLTFIEGTFEVTHEDMSLLKELAPLNIRCSLYEKQNNKTVWLEIIHSYSKSQHKLKNTTWHHSKFIHNSTSNSFWLFTNKNILKTYSSFNVNLPTSKLPSRCSTKIRHS